MKLFYCIYNASSVNLFLQANLSVFNIACMIYFSFGRSLKQSQNSSRVINAKSTFSQISSYCASHSCNTLRRTVKQDFEKWKLKTLSASMRNTSLTLESVNEPTVDKTSWEWNERSLDENRVGGYEPLETYSEITERSNESFTAEFYG